MEMASGYPSRRLKGAAVCDVNMGEKEKQRKNFISLNVVVNLLGPKIMLVCGLVKFVPAVAYHSCLNLSERFSQPRVSHLRAPQYVVWWLEYLL